MSAARSITNATRLNSCSFHSNSLEFVLSDETMEVLRWVLAQDTLKCLFCHFKSTALNCPAKSFRNRYIFLIDQRTILLVTDDEKEFSSRFYTRTGSTCDNPGFIIMNLFITIFHTAAKLRLQAFWSTQSMSSTQNLTESESVAKSMMVKTGDFQTQTEAQTEIIGPWSWRASWADDERAMMSLNHFQHDSDNKLAQLSGC